MTDPVSPARKPVSPGNPDCWSCGYPHPFGEHDGPGNPQEDS